MSVRDTYIDNIMAPSKYIVCFLCVIVFSPVQCRTIFATKDPSVGQTSAADEQARIVVAVTPYSEAREEVKADVGMALTRARDSEYKMVLKKKRCGVMDKPKFGRTRRDTIDDFGKWYKPSLTYRVVNGSRTLSKERVEALVEKAFAIWAPHCGLQFTPEKSGRADLMISFERGDHDDGFPFDGPLMTVAHAFFPNSGNKYAGVIHFDDDEEWLGSDSPGDNSDGTQFFKVALHEIGHALGLPHSNITDSIMYGSYSDEMSGLSEVDILAIRKIYLNGESVKAIETVTASSPAVQRGISGPQLVKDEPDQPKSENPDLCMTTYDTLQTIHGKIYVFAKEWVWVLSDRGMLEGSPRRFHEVFDGLPASVTSIKTIYQKTNGNVVIFSGRNFWEFDATFRLVTRGNLSKYFIPSRFTKLTTVFRSNDKTYLVANKLFWRYDERLQRMEKGYPKYMSVWGKVPNPVDAAFIWKGDTLFFQGPQFWRFDYKKMAAQESQPVAQTWFNCPAAPK